MERKLTAILSADVKGYSRLMGVDEEGTLRTLTAYRQILDTFIARHHGRIVGTAGDSVLAEFASVVDAVQCALVAQTTLKAENATLPAEQRMEFRIGINLGDVMVQGEQIYGDGVNIAARLESLAAPGGICISGTVHEHIKNKLALAYEDLGEQQVKNIAEPVRVWRVVVEPAAAAGHKVPSPPAGEGQGEGASGRAGTVTTPHPDLPPQGGKEPKTRRLGTAYLIRAALILMGLLIVGAVMTFLYPSLPTFITHHSALITQEALPLPDKPSIVVLPFVNMSEDPKQEYFSDGITEDLTTALSQISNLFVIARNSAFTYKGKTVKVQDIGRELGVRYVLEGSVRKADNQVRINAQLIDATTGGHLWSERYDRSLKDIFALQDEIIQKIVTTLKLQLALWKQGILVHKTTDNLEAYDYYLRGQEYYWHVTKESNTQARQMFEKAIELDPQYAEAYASLGFNYSLEWIQQWSQDSQALEQAFALAQKAVALDDALPGAHTTLGWVYLMKKQHDRAIAEAERAIALDPNNDSAYSNLGLFLGYVGRPAEAIEPVEKAIRLNPRYVWHLYALGWTYNLAGRCEEAIAVEKRVLTRAPNFAPAYWTLAVCSEELGRMEEAQAAAAEFMRLAPSRTLEEIRATSPFKDPARLERQLTALRKAGLK